MFLIRIFVTSSPQLNSLIKKTLNEELRAT